MIFHIHFLKNFFFVLLKERMKRNTSAGCRVGSLELKCFQSSSLLSLEHVCLSPISTDNIFNSQWNSSLNIQDMVCFSFYISELTFPDLPLLLSIKSGCALKTYLSLWFKHIHAQLLPSSVCLWVIGKYHPILLIQSHLWPVTAPKTI